MSSALTIRPVLGQAQNGPVDIPLAARWPVLITGEAGSGKTVLLDRVATFLPASSVSRRSLHDDPEATEPDPGVEVLMLDDCDNAFTLWPQEWLLQLERFQRRGGVTIAVTHSLHPGHFGGSEQLRNWLLRGTVIRFRDRNRWDVLTESVVDLTIPGRGECWVQAPADLSPVLTTVPALLR